MFVLLGTALKAASTEETNRPLATRMRRSDAGTGMSAHAGTGRSTVDSRRQEGTLISDIHYSLLLSYKLPFFHVRHSCV
jgi:hypothetical protein